MFTEDYLMRIINQVLAALMAAAGLRKKGRYEEARQAIDQAVEQLTTLPASVVDMMEDSEVLSSLSANGSLEVGRLSLLADLYDEEGQILLAAGMQDQANAVFSRALRFNLETALSDDTLLTNETCKKIETGRNRLKTNILPIDTLLALSDYYQRLLARDDSFLASIDISRPAVDQILHDLQNQIRSNTPSLGG
jgi:tetratricopeptide (TPR) repeat protein